MQLTIKANGKNVRVLSYLLAKNPDNLYERQHKGHFIRFFYSKFSDQELEAVIFVTPDPLELVKNSAAAYDITHYINDREFVVSSIFCSLVRSALGTALNGQPKEDYREWVDQPFSLEFQFGPVASTLSDQQLRDLFEPLGYETTIAAGEANYSFSVKAKSSARFLSIKGETTLQTGLRQLFVLIPVMDNYKHYFIDEKEIEKLERYGQGWLETHPQKQFILRHALRFKEIYNKLEYGSFLHPGASSEPKTDVAAGQKAEKKVRLNEQRYQKIIDIINQENAKETIVDLGSGEGKLAVQLGCVNGVKEILAVEPSEYASLQALERFQKREQKPGFLVPTPVFSSLFYYDERLANKDIMILCEVIEHIDEYRLPKIIEMIFKDYRPKMLIITTPNKEYNDVYDLRGHFRHDDHRFEWTRAEFRRWCEQNSGDYPYELTFDGIGEEHEAYGCPTQLCKFVRKEGE